MSIYKTAYNTTVGSAFVTSKTINAVKHVLIAAPTNSDSSTEPILRSISGSSSYENEVPGFVHPLLVTAIDKKEYLFSDVRPFVKIVGEDVIIKNTSEYKLLKARLVTTKAWITIGPDALSGISILPQQVFSAWISEAIRQRFALDPLDQLKLAVIACFYYQSLFVDQSTFDEETKDKFMANCIRSVKAPAKLVIEVIQKIDNLSNIESFCKTVQVILENPRLEHFNAGLLISILKGSWFGTNSAEIVGVSLEHPPTWISLIYISIAERTYRNSNLSKITERFLKGGAENYFTRGFVSLAKSITLQGEDENSF